LPLQSIPEVADKSKDLLDGSIDNDTLFVLNHSGTPLFGLDLLEFF
jgi:hypothetical protein